MTFKVNFIERQSVHSPSIERVFRKVAECLDRRGIETFFEKVPHGDGAANVFRNLLEFRPKSADIYHVTGHVTYIGLILPRDRTVITFHDLTLLTIRQGLRRDVLKKLYYAWPASRATKITAISQATAEELSKTVNIARSCTTVIDNPCLIHPIYSNKRFNEARPRILQIGTAVNKNVVNLLRAVAGLECVVHIVGPMTNVIERELRALKLQFENSTSLDETGMVEAYRQADILAFCSTIEGFGLPIIEAQAIGVPVVTSDLSPMREVAGDGALKVNPTDPHAIRRAIDSLIASPELRAKLTEAGRKNAIRFDPERVASDYEALYRKILISVN